jgi:hypothetical protein
VFQAATMFNLEAVAFRARRLTPPKPQKDRLLPAPTLHTIHSNILTSKAAPQIVQRPYRASKQQWSLSVPESSLIKEELGALLRTEESAGAVAGNAAADVAPDMVSILSYVGAAATETALCEQFQWEL